MSPKKPKRSTRRSKATKPRSNAEKRYDSAWVKAWADWEDKHGTMPPGGGAGQALKRKLMEKQRLELMSQAEAHGRPFQLEALVKEVTREEAEQERIDREPFTPWASQVCGGLLFDAGRRIGELERERFEHLSEAGDGRGWAPAREFADWAHLRMLADLERRMTPGPGDQRDDPQIAEIAHRIEAYEKWRWPIEHPGPRGNLIEGQVCRRPEGHEPPTLRHLYRHAPRDQHQHRGHGEGGEGDAGGDGDAEGSRQRQPAAGERVARRVSAPGEADVIKAMKISRPVFRVMWFWCAFIDGYAVSRWTHWYDIGAALVLFVGAMAVLFVDLQHEKRAELRFKQHQDELNHLFLSGQAELDKIFNARMRGEPPRIQ